MLNKKTDHAAIVLAAPGPPTAVPVLERSNLGSCCGDGSGWEACIWGTNMGLQVGMHVRLGRRRSFLLRQNGFTLNQLIQPLAHHRTIHPPTHARSVALGLMEEIAAMEDQQRDVARELLQKLPAEIGMGGNLLYLYQGFWCPQVSIKGMMLFQQHFKAQETDLILASIPKSGTTWLKALTYTIVDRSRCSLEKSPLLTIGPHGVVPFLEFDISSENHFQELDRLPNPRIFGTHSPYPALPCSVKDSAAKIVYVCRNPVDMFISYWKFSVNIRKEEEKHLSLEDAFEKFCQGLHGYGPFWDHLLGYWKASLERPDKVLFLKYEDMKKNGVLYIKKLANFVGLPFSMDEEKQGLAEEISRLCSFESMKSYEATRTGTGPLGIPASAFLRKGEVGDSLNYLTPSMVSRVEYLIREKLQDSGLRFFLGVQHNPK